MGGNLNKQILAGIILGFALFVSYSLVAQALSEADIVYPVAELGNCKNEQGCKSFCDKPENIEACVSFAEKYELISKDEAERGRKFAATGAKGPGGCNSQDSCENYCNDVTHIDECLAFAEKNDLMPKKELEEARKVQAALAKGAQLPGGCKNKNECDTFCENPDNMETCITFAETAGFIEGDELKEAKQVLEAVRKGAKPPPCRGKNECDAYCGEPENFEQCIVFAEAAGFVSKEDAEMARKTGGKGPGNCRGKEECESFCQNPQNQETCFSFAKEHGLISEDQLREMEEGKGKMMEGLNQAPPEVLECLNSSIGADKIEGLKSGAVMPSRDIGDKMQSCFSQMMEQMGPPEGFEGEFEGGFEGEPSPEMMEQYREQMEQFQGQGEEQFKQQFQKEFQKRMMEQGPMNRLENNEFLQNVPEEFKEQLKSLPPQQFQNMLPGQEFQGSSPGGQMMPSEGMMQPPSPEQMQQYQQQMQQQYQQMPQYQQMMPPSGGESPPPPPSEPPPPPPQSSKDSLFGNVLEIFKGFIF